MLDLRTTLTAARRCVGCGSRVVRLLSFLLISTVGLSSLQGSGESLFDDEADRDERVVFRHFV